MRTLVHLSDLHFGRVDERIIKPLISAVTEINPDLVAVSAFDWASFHITFLSGISLIGDADDVLDFCAKLSVVWA